MNLTFCLQTAGAMQLLVAAANFILPTILRYDENLAQVSRIIRQIFHVHALYIVLVLTGLGLACLFLPRELLGPGLLGKCLCAYLTFFWGLRTLIQCFYYDRETREDHPFGNIFFGFIFLTLTAIFAAATFHTP
jgi:hypothetical protein